MRIIKIIILIAFTSIFLSGCRTLNPEDESPQPWAQPEEWQKNPTIPGFNNNGDGF